MNNRLDARAEGGRGARKRARAAAPLRARPPSPRPQRGRGERVTWSLRGRGVACRFLAYLGTDPQLIADVVLWPTRSIIKQSYCALERRNDPGLPSHLRYGNLNGDGFGIGWYPTPEPGREAPGAERASEGAEEGALVPLAPQAQAALACPAPLPSRAIHRDRPLTLELEPCTFTSITPAWNNANLGRLSTKIRSDVIFAHVRAAYPGMPVSEQNCHPFACGRYLFMHNGVVGGFLRIRRRLLARLRDEAYDAVQSFHSDSSVCFALFLDAILRFQDEEDAARAAAEGEDGARAAEAPAPVGARRHGDAFRRPLPPRTLLRALRSVVAATREEQIAAGVNEFSLLNFVVTDGESLVAIRYASSPDIEPATLYYAEGSTYERTRPSQRAEAMAREEARTAEARDHADPAPPAPAPRGDARLEPASAASASASASASTSAGGDAAAGGGDPASGAGAGAVASPAPPAGASEDNTARAAREESLTGEADYHVTTAVGGSRVVLVASEPVTSAASDWVEIEPNTGVLVCRGAADGIVVLRFAVDDPGQDGREAEARMIADATSIGEGDGNAGRGEVSPPAYDSPARLAQLAQGGRAAAAPPSGRPALDSAAPANGLAQGNGAAPASALAQGNGAALPTAHAPVNEGFLPPGGASALAGGDGLADGGAPPASRPLPAAGEASFASLALPSLARVRFSNGTGASPKGSSVARIGSRVSSPTSPAVPPSPRSRPAHEAAMLAVPPSRPSSAVERRAPTDLLLHVLAAHSGAILCLCVAGRTFYSGGLDGVIRGWSLGSLEQTCVLRGHRDSVRSLRVRGPHLLSLGAKTLRVWRLADRSPVAVVPVFDVRGSGRAMDVAPGGRVALGGQNCKVTLVGLPEADADAERILRGEAALEPAAAQSARCAAVDARASAPCSDALEPPDSPRDLLPNETVRSALARAREPLFVASPRHSGSVLAVAADDTYVYSSAEDARIRVWRADDLSFVRELRGHRGPSGALLPAGDVVLSGGRDGDVRVWDRRSLLCRRVLTGHRAGICSLAVATAPEPADPRDDGIADESMHSAASGGSPSARSDGSPSPAPRSANDAESGGASPTTGATPGGGSPLSLAGDAAVGARGAWAASLGRFAGQLATPSPRLLSSTAPSPFPVHAQAPRMVPVAFASGSRDGVARLWSAATWSCLRVLELGAVPCSLALMSGHLLVGSCDGAVRVADVSEDVYGAEEDEEGVLVEGEGDAAAGDGVPSAARSRRGASGGHHHEHLRGRDSASPSAAGAAPGGAASPSGHHRGHHHAARESARREAEGPPPPKRHRAPDDATAHAERELAAAPPRTLDREFERALRAMVAMRTASCDPRCRDESFRAAKFLASLLESIGCEARLAASAPGRNPVVFGRIGRRQDVPTVCLYAHYDVQPAREPDWRTNPWQLASIDGYYYGRGVSDNKGPILAFIYALKEIMSGSADKSDGLAEAGPGAAAPAAAAATAGAGAAGGAPAAARPSPLRPTLDPSRLPVNVAFAIEGEEESGSKGFLDAVTDAREDVFSDVDAILVSNTTWVGERVPCVTYGMRGMLGVRVTLTGPTRDVHSGTDGGAFLEPLSELTKLLGTLTDASGRIAVPGFHDDVAPAKAPELQKERLWRSGEFDVERYKKNLGVPRLAPAAGSDERAVLNARWCQPSLSVVDVRAGKGGWSGGTIWPVSTVGVRPGAGTAGASGPAGPVPSSIVADARAHPTPLPHTRSLPGPSDAAMAEQAQVTAYVPPDPQPGPFFPSAGAVPERSAPSPTPGAYPGQSLAHYRFGPTRYSVVPNSATALVCIRFVPRQDAMTLAKLLEDHLAHELAKLGSPNSLQVTVDSAGDWWDADLQSPFVRAAARAVESEWGVQPLLVREGGTMPVARALERALDAPVAMIPLGQSSDAAHLANERMRRVNLFKGKAVFRRFLQEVGKVGKVEKKA